LDGMAVTAGMLEATGREWCSCTSARRAAGAGVRVPVCGAEERRGVEGIKPRAPGVLAVRPHPSGHGRTCAALWRGQVGVVVVWCYGGRRPKGLPNGNVGKGFEEEEAQHKPLNTTRLQALQVFPHDEASKLGIAVSATLLSKEGKLRALGNATSKNGKEACVSSARALTCHFDGCTAWSRALLTWCLCIGVGK
jgi:hypothetical protein